MESFFGWGSLWVVDKILLYSRKRKDKIVGLGLGLLRAMAMILLRESIH